MRFLRLLANALIAASLCAAAHANSKLPDWLQTAVKQPAPPRHQDEKPTREVLWDEATYEVLRDGSIKQTVRYAIRILDLQDRWRAKAQVSYRSSSDSRPKIAAWTLHADGTVYKYKKSDEKEASNNSYLTLATESRIVTVDGWNETRTGDVFAYEYTATESSIFTQYYWGFQSDAPVALSRLTIIAPPDWTIEETFFFANPQKTRSDTSVTWELRNLLSKKREPYSPSSAAKLQHMIATITPSADSPRRFTNLHFDSWQDLAAFKAKVSDPMATPSKEIAAKAAELTRDAPSIWEKIQALGEYAKAVNYEHVALKIGNGGGYTPRPATETFRSGWGDCKDKSTLLRALLKSVGIESYVVSLNATDNDYADESMPSPFFFDHCITAIEVDETIDTPAVYQHPSLGRLLFVDPTWNDSPIGEIPYEAQGGLAVVGKLAPNPIVRLPLSTPEQNTTEREIVAEVMSNGALFGRVNNTLRGQSAVKERRLLANLSDKAYNQNLSEQFAAGGNPSPVTKIVETSDEYLGDLSYRSTIDFAYADYAKNMRNTLLIFKPAILGRLVDNPFSEPKRTLPVRLRSRMTQERAKIYLPQDYTLDEYQPTIAIETDFGSYHATIEKPDGENEINYTRVFKVHDTTVPLHRYKELQAFYHAVIEAEQKPVVLSRIPPQ